MDVEQICDRLGMKPTRKWTVGRRRETPKGFPLNGVNESTYCFFRLEHPEGIQLVDFIDVYSDELYRHKGFFEELRSTGGSLEYFIGWYSDRNSGQVFNLGLLSKLVALGIGLSIDFYGGSDDMIDQGDESPAD
jgi:hypothetical protein